MGSPQTISTFNGMLRDLWVKDRMVPVPAYKDSGAGWRGMEKRITTDTSGKGVMNYPTAVGLPGGISADFGTAASQAGGGSYRQWVVNLQRECWNMFGAEWNAIEFSNGPNAYDGVIAAGLLSVAKAWHNYMSTTVWRDGGGHLAQVSPTATVTAGTTVIQLTNVDDAIRFEAADLLASGAYSGGNIVQFSTDSGLGGAGPKAFETRVVGVNLTAGQLTVSPALDGTVATSDFIFLKGTYGVMPQGFLAWCPEDVADLTGTFNGVNRAALPEKLGGNREAIALGDDPYDVIMRSRRIMKTRGIKADLCAVTPAVWEKLDLSLRDKGVTITENARGADPAKIAMGITGVKFQNPAIGRDLVVYCDEYLGDSTVAADESQIYCFYARDEFGYATSPDGINWRDHEKSGTYLQQIPDSKLVKAYYGAIGNFYSLCPRNMLVMSPNVQA